MSSAEIKPKKSKKSKTTEPSADVASSTEPNSSSSKKDKKRKATSDEPSAQAEGGGEDAEAAAKKEKKRLKKEKKAAAAVAAATSGEAEVAQAGEGTVDPPASSSKKDKKSNKSSAAVDAPSTSSVPSTVIPATNLTSNTTLTPASQAYLTENNITLSHPYNPLLDLSTLPIDKRIAPALKEFAKPTPIQACSWPALFDGKDVVGVAETGSGKTLGFGIPAMQHLLSLPALPHTPIPSPSILIVSPTRELALQTHATMSTVCTLLGFKSVCLFGGMPKVKQVEEMRQPGVKCVVGTPGRVLDMVNDKSVSFSRVTYLVLDEADRMLDKGFENDIRQIIGQCPTEKRQTLMFSATWPESVRSLAATFMKTPTRITVGSDELTANARVSQSVEVFNTSRDKDPRLLTLLKSHSTEYTANGKKNVPLRILVFALYKKEATRLEQTIRRAGYKVGGLHGDMGQAERMRALEGFVSGDVGVLVATDVAARGLDIPDVSLVINVTFPLTVEDYIHRIGRTGRGGKMGKSVTFFTGENHETALAGEFMRVLRDANVEIPKEMDRFPSTIRKKEHGSYGAFFKDISDAPAPKKIKF